MLSLVKILIINPLEERSRKMSINEGTDRMVKASGLSVANDGIHRPHGEYTSDSMKSQTMKKGIDMEDNLVKGGCGHSAEELEASAIICTVAFVLMLAILIVSAIIAA